MLPSDLLPHSLLELGIFGATIDRSLGAFCLVFQHGRLLDLITVVCLNVLLQALPSRVPYACFCTFLLLRLVSIRCKGRSLLDDRLQMFDRWLLQARGCGGRFATRLINVVQLLSLFKLLLQVCGLRSAALI